MEEKNEIIQFQNTEIVRDSQYESQVDIAKRYPRNLSRIIQNSIAIATMDIETATSCNYSLPRAGKSISGESVHLARIIVQQYGNVRVESKVTHSDATQVHAEAICFDLETNVAVKVTTSKPIVYNSGKRYSEDMIVTTGKAASSIAYRNAVFAVVPKSIVTKVYKAALQLITGDISDETKLIQQRKKALDYFLSDWTVTETEILTALGLKSTNQIKADQLVILRGMLQSLKDGEFSVEEMFSRIDEKATKDPKINTPKNEK